jgi:O-antigen/teichoic acid export membrane protein
VKKIKARSPKSNLSLEASLKRLCSLLIFVLFISFTFTPGLAQEEDTRVFYAGPEGPVKSALQLAKFTLVEDLAQADAWVINGSTPGKAELSGILQSGLGGLLILGPEFTQEDMGQIFGEGISYQVEEGAVSLQPSEDTSLDQVLVDVLWSSAPQVRQRMKLVGSDFIPLITAYENGELILGKDGNRYVFSPFLNGNNPQFQEWPYFNYLVYHLVTQAAGRDPVSFGDYWAAPIPQPAQRVILYIAMGILVIITWTIFFVVRRYSQKHPEKLDSLVSDREAFMKREANTDWEQIGFHRSIGGFMFALSSGLLLFIPLVAYQNFILPVYILPSAQAMGMWGRVSAMFPLIWSLFDMGTSVAHMKYFAEYRIHNPGKAIQYAQFFVWWQALTGAIQVALVVSFTAAFFPDSAYAILIWSIITHAMIQIPGFYRIFTDSLSAYQRADYNQILDIGMTMVIPMIIQPIVISLMVYWGRNHPVFGPAMGGLLGLGVAAYVMEVCSFLLGWYLYNRLGYNARLLFLAHFDARVAWQSLKYGVFFFLSGSIAGLSSWLTVTVIQPKLLNTNEIMGNLGLANTFPFAFSVLQTLTATVLPAISEAVTNGKRILGQYYSTMVYKFGGFVSGFIAAVLLSVADRFIIGSSGQDFQRAATYVGPLIVIAAFNFIVMGGEVVIYAIKSRLIVILAVIDFAIGLTLTYLLIDTWQVNAIIYIPAITLGIKALVVYFLNNRYCFPQKFYFWQSLGAPILASLTHLLWLRWVTGLIWQGDEITSILILAFGLLISYPIYSFLYGFFGGWDEKTPAEFDRGTNLSSFMRPMTRLFYHSSRWGSRVSPLFGRFPISNFQPARSEAEALTQERVKLIQAE